MPWAHLTPSFASGGAATVRGSNSLRIRTTNGRTSAFRQTWIAKSLSRSGRTDNPRNATRLRAKAVDLRLLDASSAAKVCPSTDCTLPSASARLVGLLVIGQITAEPQASDERVQVLEARLQELEIRLRAREYFLLKSASRQLF
jgi:hypothetical protein